MKNYEKVEGGIAVLLIILVSLFNLTIINAGVTQIASNFIYGLTGYSLPTLFKLVIMSILYIVMPITLVAISIILEKIFIPAKE